MRTHATKTNRKKSKESRIGSGASFYLWYLCLHSEILVDKDYENAVKSIFKKIESVAKHDPSSVEKSFFIFTLKICGLDSLVDKINWREPVQSLNELLDGLGEDSNFKSVNENELYLINPKSKFHKEFIERVNNFLAVSISDELPLLSESNILKTVFEVLLSISKCKLRNIRNCSVVLSGLILKRFK